VPIHDQQRRDTTQARESRNVRPLRQDPVPQLSLHSIATPATFKPPFRNRIANPGKNDEMKQVHGIRQAAEIIQNANVFPQFEYAGQPHHKTQYRTPESQHVKIGVASSEHHKYN
jgi:hypothetical protein